MTTQQKIQQTATNANADPDRAPCLIALPGGLAVSGVARFAARLAGGLAAQGHPAGLILHAPPPGTAPLKIGLHPGVRVFDLGDQEPIESAQDPAAFVPAYRDAASQLGGGRPAALVLGQHAGTFAIAAALSLGVPDAIRSIGVAHSDNGYDTPVLAHYQRILAGLVGVSDRITASLHEAAPDATPRITRIPYGIEVPPALADRPPTGGRPSALLYAGRLEHRQKRVAALPLLSAELEARGVPHRLTIVGDGPAREDIRDASRDSKMINILPAATPAEIAALLDSHDAFVLPSRFEGLSIAMLEALAHGCVPVVAPSRSGTAEAITQGVTGEIAACTPDDDEAAVAHALADSIETLRRRDLAETATRCHALARDRFSIEHHLDAWNRLIDRAIHDEPRQWPLDRPCSFDSASRSTPGPETFETADAAERVKTLLRSIRREPVCVHGAGAHTLAIAHAIADANIVAISDDDRQAHGSRFLGWTVIDPSQAANAGASHVIISSRLHEPAIWARRSVYEQQGLKVHRLYSQTSSPEAEDS
ncbi:MAG: glycosyltransferase family 4 protein [Planctomycetota bacterium]